MQGEAADRDAAAAAVDRDRLWLAMGCGDLVNLAAEAAQPFDDRLVFGDFGVARHDEGQGVLHLPEGRGNLHQPAELDLLGEIARRRDQKRKDDRQLLIAAGEPGQLLAPADHLPPIQDAMGEAVLKDVELAALAAVERDRTRLKRKSAS